MLPVRVALAPRTWAAVVPTVMAPAAPAVVHQQRFMHNSANGAAQPSAAKYTAPPSSVPMDASSMRHTSTQPAGRGGPATSFPGDWRCDGCGATNFARRQQCFKCARDKTSSAPVSASSNIMSAAARQPASNASVKSSSDWLCALCHTTNFGSRAECFMCNTARDKTAGSASAAAAPSTTEDDGDMIRISDIDVHQASSQPTAAQVSSSHSLGARGSRGINTQKKKGDWTCGSCKNHNFASREVCFSCTAPKAAAESIVTENEVSSVGGVSSNRSNGFNKKFAQMQGDWLCTGCGVHNFRNRESCRSCSIAKEGHAKILTADDAMMPGDWKCPSCSEMNFRKRELCRACSTPKPAEVLRQQPMGSVADDGARSPAAIASDEGAARANVAM